MAGIMSFVQTYTTPVLGLRGDTSISIIWSTCCKTQLQQRPFNAAIFHTQAEGRTTLAALIVSCARKRSFA
eukprot:54240-Eustigmatos_ZCMA.PRE.1